MTGAAQGIGLATALRLAQEGATVVVADRAAEPAAAAVSAIKEAGGVAHLAVYDLESYGDVVAMFDGVKRDCGRIDIAIHNVGGTIWTKPFREYQVDEIEAEVQRSLWPTIWSCYVALPLMIEQGGGSIVNVGSFATRGVNRVPYSAAKGGVDAITKSLALEAAPYGIRVNCVAPGGIDVGHRATPRNTQVPTENERRWLQEAYDQTIRDTPLKRLGTPAEVANAICFMASREATYITGQILYVAGGGIG